MVRFFCDTHLQSMSPQIGNRFRGILTSPTTTETSYDSIIVSFSTKTLNFRSYTTLWIESNCIHRLFLHQSAVPPSPPSPPSSTENLDRLEKTPGPEIHFVSASSSGTVSLIHSISELYTRQLLSIHLIDIYVFKSVVGEWSIHSETISTFTFLQESFSTWCT